MKKILAILAAVVAVCACSQDVKVRRAITKEIKRDLAAPGSFKFVGMERVKTFTVATELERAADLVPKQGRGMWVEDGNGGGRMTYEITERKLDGLIEVASAMPSDSVVGGVYRFSFRADVPGKGRDFPQEVYAVAATDGTIGAIGSSASDAVYRSPTIVASFREFTRRDPE